MCVVRLLCRYGGEISPRGVEALDGLLLVAPARGVLVLAGAASAGHGALHVTRDDVPQGLPNFGVLRRRDPGTDWQG